MKKTGRYPYQPHYTTDVSTSGYSGRHVVVTVWKASHVDQKYFLCSDVNFGSPSPRQTERARTRHRKRHGASCGAPSTQYGPGGHQPPTQLLPGDAGCPERVPHCPATVSRTPGPSRPFVGPRPARRWCIAQLCPTGPTASRCCAYVQFGKEGDGGPPSGAAIRTASVRMACDRSAEPESTPLRAGQGSAGCHDPARQAEPGRDLRRREGRPATPLGGTPSGTIPPAQGAGSKLPDLPALSARLCRGSWSCRGQLPGVRQDFGRGISRWSR
ncbi:lytic polysaccharide monooxygenase [Streptomyces longisporoflavus]|uniref:Lytic polysaccharide monooxygenase n=1 Tax=Streptomyces longisporoflavus TaxID=28044 RepID=A0ABW7QKB7_9ACTN